MRPTTSARTASLLIAAVIVVFAFSRGLQRVLTALALDSLGPWTLTAASLALATMLWFPLAAARGWLTTDRRLWARCLPLGVVNIAIPGIAFTAAQLFVSASAAALLVAALPIVIAVFAAVFLTEHLKAPAIAGIALGTTGVVTLTLGKGGALDASNWWLGVGLCAIGILAAATVYVGWRTLLAEHPGPVILGPQLLAATGTVLPVALLAQEPRTGTLTVTLAAQLAALALANYVIPQLAMFWLLARTTAVRASLPNYLAPLVATVLAIPVLGQAVTAVSVAGGVLIIAGAVLVNTARARR